MKMCDASSLAVTLLMLSLVSCGKKDAHVPTQAEVPMAQSKPWTYAVLNGVLVVQGEVDRPTDLILESHSIRETRHAEFGPVRWELFCPPTGETTTLHTAEGQPLATWHIGTAPRERKPERKPDQRVSTRAAQMAMKSEDPLEQLRRQVAAANRVDPLESTISISAAEPVFRAPRPVASPILPPILPPIPTPTMRPTMRADLKKWPSKLGAVRMPEAPRPLPIPSAIGSETRIQPSPSPIVPTPLLSGVAPWSGAGEAFNLVRGPKSSQGTHRMVLSFDGGSSDESATEILDALKSRGVRTTLFLTGAFVQKFPDQVRRMAREGHELGNHTMNHPHFAPGMKRDAKWTKDRFQNELLSADRALFKLLGRPFDPYWRAPYGEQTKELREWAEEIGFRHVGWTEGADSLDWATPNEKRIYRSGDAVLARLHARIEKQDSDGLIVLMHLGSGRPEEDRPSKNLGAFMDRAAKDGWHFVRIGDYLQELHKPAWNPAARISLLEQTGSAGGASTRAGLRK